ncbi:hypothetical protein M9458_039108 [Cirrhinus mrigala]|uniref:Uncharacterized protein n=1 Tax=Cirrhinus mrigala TaxID=683832 RepID=A0ABD0NZH3_CIRMR
MLLYFVSDLNVYDEASCKRKLSEHNKVAHMKLLFSQWAEPLLWMHQSRVRDVEWITGLDFFQDSKRPVAELLRLKTRPTAAIHPKA